jgi:hypothetical protein
MVTGMDIRKASAPFFWLGLCIAAIVSSLPLTSCGSSNKAEPPKAGNKYREDILLAAKQSKSEEERKILADGSITRAEYEEAVNRTIKCVDDKGYKLNKISNPGGYYTFSMETSEAGDKAYTECKEKFSSSVELYYGDQIINPDKRDLDELTVECFQRKRIAPPSYTAAQLKTDLKKGFKNSPVVPETPEWLACMGNPSLP